jgi:Fe-S-cluster containining protein
MASNKIVLAVEDVYRQIDTHISVITSKTGMKCVNLCNACCRRVDIEASTIECFPLAAWLYEAGMVDEFLIRLDKSDENGYCVLFSPEAWKKGEWGCLNYEKRGLICRLFGFGYRLNRHGCPELVTCKVMKEFCPEAVAEASRKGIESPGEIPLFRDYSMQLFGIDPDLSIQQFPINKAIRKAIERLYFHYASCDEPENRE